MVKRPRNSSLSTDASHHITSTPSQYAADPDTSVAKIIHIDRSDQPAKIHCHLPPHAPLPFESYEDFEVHYHKTHVNRCSACHKNFPTEHFLALHISENHDPIVATRRERGDKTYACFVEGCNKVCATWQKRRMHLVDKHMFPRNYDFFIVNDGLDGRRTLLRPERRPQAREAPLQTTTDEHHDAVPIETSPSAPESVSMTAENDSGDPMDTLTKDMSALKFVPSSVRFGRKQGLSGFSKT